MLEAPLPRRQGTISLCSMWVTDDSTPEFAAEAHRQSAAVAASEHSVDDQAFIDALSVDVLT